MTLWGFRHDEKLVKNFFLEGGGLGAHAPVPIVDATTARWVIGLFVTSRLEARIKPDSINLKGG